MGYCTPNNPEDEPYYSWITCPLCDGTGMANPNNHGMGECFRCKGDGEVIFEQE